MEIRAIHRMERGKGGKAYDDIGAKWYKLDGMLSSDVAGEIAAVNIYAGARRGFAWHVRLFRVFGIFQSRNARSLISTANEFANTHMAAEAQHLKILELLLPDHMTTVLLGIWALAGYLIGFLPAFFGGPRAVYHTVDAVETFVEHHYQCQIDYLEKIRHDVRLDTTTDAVTSLELIPLIQSIQADEMQHKDEAREALYGNATEDYSISAKIWRSLVTCGCWLSAEIAKRV